VRRRQDAGKRFSLIVVAEGAKLVRADDSRLLIQPYDAVDE
jgi:hypothetical protein